MYAPPGKYTMPIVVRVTKHVPFLKCNRLVPFLCKLLVLTYESSHNKRGRLVKKVLH